MDSTKQITDQDLIDEVLDDIGYYNDEIKKRHTIAKETVLEKSNVKIAVEDLQHSKNKHIEDLDLINELLVDNGHSSDKFL